MIIWDQQGFGRRMMMENRKSFLCKMNLSSINITSKEHIEFWYNDCGLFEGHSILVAGDFENGFTEASIQG